jgi:hypothetical protein
MKNRKLGGLVLAAAAALGACYQTSSQAALVLDLRVARSTDLTAADQGTTIPIQVWAVVTGANAGNTDEGIEYVYYNVRSTLGGTPLGQLASAQLVAPFASAGSQVGDLVDRNADGILDLGASGNTRQTAPGNQNARPGFSPTVLAGASDGTNNALANGREWLVETINFRVADQLPESGSLNFAIQTVAGGLSPSFRIQEDGVARTSTSATAYSGGSSVTFTSVVPEPASLSALGLGALALLARRRK